MKKRIHVIFSGHVQGVGFRYTVWDIAHELGLRGWVKNLHDGSVEMVAEGEEQDLDQLMSRIKDRFGSYIRDLSLQSLPATDSFQDFEITY